MGAVSHLPKKFSQVFQIIYKRVEKKQGPYCNNIGREGGLIQFFRVNAKFEHKLRRHKQTLGKIATTVDENLS